MNAELMVLIVDDEVPARSKVARLVRESLPEAQILEAGNGKCAIELLEKNQIDLMFLDIQMPVMTGMELVRTVGADNLPVTIFVTAYNEFAVEAFEIEAVDYLLKPFDSDRFSLAFQRALKRLENPEDLGDVLRRLLKKSKTEEPLEKILVRDGVGKVVLNTSDIYYLKSEEKYVNLYTRDREYIIRSSLTALLERLSPSHIVRIHRCNAVNLDHVHRVEPLFHGDQVVIMNNGHKLTCSRRFRNNLPGVP